MTYVDGFVLAVPTANKHAYIAHAQTSAAVLKDLGALSVMEAWGDDVPDGKVTSMAKAVQAKQDETVVFGWITWPSKTMRDFGMEAFMAHPNMQPENNPAPYDGQRLIFGGFEAVVDV